MMTKRMVATLAGAMALATAAPALGGPDMAPAAPPTLATQGVKSGEKQVLIELRLYRVRGDIVGEVYPDEAASDQGARPSTGRAPGANAPSGMGSSRPVRPSTGAAVPGSVLPTAPPSVPPPSASGAGFGGTSGRQRRRSTGAVLPTEPSPDSTNAPSAGFGGTAGRRPPSSTGAVSPEPRPVSTNPPSAGPGGSSGNRPPRSTGAVAPAAAPAVPIGGPAAVPAPAPVSLPAVGLDVSTGFAGGSPPFFQIASPVRAKEGEHFFFTRASLSVAGVRLRADEDGWTWDGRLQPPEGRKIEVLAAPKVILLLGQTFEVSIGSQQPVQYFEKRSDGLFELKTVEQPTGLAFSGKAEEGPNGGIVLRDLAVVLSSIEKRDPVDGVNLDIGAPTIRKREFKSTIHVRPGAVCGMQLGTEGFGHLLLQLSADFVSPDGRASVTLSEEVAPLEEAPGETEAVKVGEPRTSRSGRRPFGMPR